jgi:hypothetical protein
MPMSPPPVLAADRSDHPLIRFQNRTAQVGVAILISVLLFGLSESGRSARLPSFRGHLQVVARLVTPNVYEEGSIGFVQVRTKTGKLVRGRTFPTEQPKDFMFNFRLEPGPYRLISFIRACSGNCNALDPPTDRCARVFVMRSGANVSTMVRMRPGHGCSIQFRP